MKRLEDFREHSLAYRFAAQRATEEEGVLPGMTTLLYVKKGKHGLHDPWATCELMTVDDNG